MFKSRVTFLFASLLALGCQLQPSTHATQDWVETQMFFGLSGPHGRRIPDSQWHDFVDRVITPRFPDGLTLLYGEGQYRGDDAAIHKEPSAILIVLHPSGDDSKLNEIAKEYARQFHQESVLRSDLPAKTEFISTPAGN